MKRFVILAMMAIGLTSVAFAFEGNLGPPDNAETTTFSEVLEQNNVLSLNGWDIVKIESIRIQEAEFSMLLKYERPVLAEDLKEELIFATKPISNYTIQDYQDTKFTILSQKRKPKASEEVKEKYKYRWKSGSQMGSAGGMPYFNTKRVAHV